jgi:hypothetical protein
MRDNLTLLADLEQQRRAILRLEEGFRLEKDDALEAGACESLLRLRERSRTRYQPELARIRNEVLRLSGLLLAGEEWYEEGISIVGTIQKKIDEAMTRFIGAPNRLLRNAETIQQLAGSRDRTVERPETAIHEEEQLRPTDPPVACPVCGSFLLADKEFTLLVCPSCGARESLEPEIPGPDEAAAQDGV